MILDGNKTAEILKTEVRSAIQEIKGRPPAIAVVMVGNNPASEIYVSRKIKACAEVGIHSLLFHLPETATEREILEKIEHLNQDDRVDSILVQLPLPKGVNPLNIASAISPDKDVDGLNPTNLGKLFMGEDSGIAPCTPLGIMSLLEKNGIDVSGKNAAVIGRSLIVGKPMGALLLKANATVTFLHSRTEDLASFIKNADLIIAAIGKPLFLKKEMVKKGAIVIDVGINRIEDAQSPKGYRLVGDADFEALKEHCSAITPVPGGVGPLTIASLLGNTLKCYKKQHS